MGRTADKGRVLFLNHVSAMGGAEKSLLELATGLMRNGKLEILAALPTGRLAQELAGAGVKVLPVAMRRMTKKNLRKNPIHLFFHWAYTVIRLARLIRREKPDLVHSNSTGAQLYGAFAARLAGCPSIWHCRDLSPLGRTGRLLSRCSAAMVCVSKAVQAGLQEQGIGAGKSTVVYNGVDPEKYRPGPPRPGLRQSLGCCSQDSLLVGMAAQLVPWKGHRLFIEAASRLAKRLPTARFVIAGEDLFNDHPGYQQELLGLAASLGLADRLLFLGYREDLPDLFKALDLLVLPSINEPFGRVLIEAMALEKPVVAMDLAGPREILRHGRDGLLVQPEAEALSAAACLLLENPKPSAAMGRSGRQRVAEDFNIRGTVDQIQALYEEILNKA